MATTTVHSEIIEMAVLEIDLVSGGTGVTTPTCSLPTGSNQVTCVCPAGTTVTVLTEVNGAKTIACLPAR